MALSRNSSTGDGSTDLPAGVATALNEPDGTISLDLGGGRDPLTGHINVDLRSIEEVDLQADATDLPMFPDGSVDRIHCSSLIPHIDDLNEAFAEWDRLLREGGELVVSATHANSTGIVQDPDHDHWSWTSRTPEWFDVDSEFAYYNDASLKLIEVTVEGWARPDHEWIRPLAWGFGHLVNATSKETADELMKLPFAAGRVEARYESI